jgi:hypothetical protein
MSDARIRDDLRALSRCKRQDGIKCVATLIFQPEYPVRIVLAESVLEHRLADFCGFILAARVSALTQCGSAASLTFKRRGWIAMTSPP